ncbi:MAG: hypothetical protein MRERV_43c012 [Mycoplasmataceae bacterium RV_VA103A]|nr:MAG: hypothetical protein MRERV_43c012 [Mycoplasmataceae bacterium RV_VA103A]
MNSKSFQTLVSREINRILTIGQIDKNRWMIDGIPCHPMDERGNLKWFCMGMGRSLIILHNEETNEVEGARYYDTCVKTIATYRKTF